MKHSFNFCTHIYSRKDYFQLSELTSSSNYSKCLIFVEDFLQFEVSLSREPIYIMNNCLVHKIREKLLLF